MKAQSGHSASAGHHVPVMLDEVLACLEPRDGHVYVDGTFGAGGYTRAILDSCDCTVYAIDRDPEAIARANDMALRYPGRLIPVEGRFGSMRELLDTAGIARVNGPAGAPRINGIVLDIGVSSMQIDEAARGFSFRHDGPLDMRMEKNGESAADVVNAAPEKELADILFNYGEERASRRIAKKIIEARAEKRIATTGDLARIVHGVLPMHGGLKTDTATRTFQALRIYVNDELAELDRALKAAELLLRPDGRLVVVSFHSLEDGRVKNFLKEAAGKAPNASRHLPQADVRHGATFDLEKAGGLKASDRETALNPRARSARLRWGIRTDVPAREASHA